MAPKQTKKVKTKTVKVARPLLASETPLRGKAARADFLQDLATASSLPLNDVKKCLDGLRLTVGRNLREHKTCRIPNMLSLRVKVYPIRGEQTQIIFGKEKVVKARPVEIKRIMISPLKPLKDDMN